MKKQLADRPEAIMINVPEAFFKDSMTQEAFERFYHLMNERDGSCFHHFISTIPVHEVITIYVCYKGKVRFRANVAQFIRNGLPEMDHPVTDTPRNWVTTCAPVIPAPFDIPQKGFRGFRYCKTLF